VAAALAASPGWALHAYQLPRTEHSAAQVVLGRGGVERRLYVDRATLRVVKAEPEEGRFMRVIFHLHGELLLGDRGSNLVELAASWAIVMILTGLYLWWPRGAGLGGVLYPRLYGRLFWRDLHAVTGFWISALALFMLVSGLPWASNWGGYLKEIRRLTGTAAAHQDWTTGRASEVALNRERDAAGMAGMPGMADMGGGAAMAPLASLAPLDRAASVVAALDLPPPVLLAPPSRPGGPWTGRSDTQDRPLRVTVTLDPATGAVLSRKGFAQQNIVDQVVAVGVAAHEGQLFGWLNQALGVALAAGLVTLSVSAVVLWWRRRPPRTLGAPAPAARPRFSLLLASLVVLLGVALPLFGASLVAVALADRLLLRRISSIRRWLDLGGAASAA
jgi:uncharacterized iron-regulated membrane protein